MGGRGFDGPSAEEGPREETEERGRSQTLECGQRRRRGSGQRDQKEHKKEQGGQRIRVVRETPPVDENRHHLLRKPATSCALSLPLNWCAEKKARQKIKNTIMSCDIVQILGVTSYLKNRPYFSLHPQNSSSQSTLESALKNCCDSLSGVDIIFF